MRAARWAVGNALHSSAQLTLTPTTALIATSSTVPFRSVGTAASHSIQVPQQNILLTPSTPSMVFGAPFRPASVDLLLTRSVAVVSTGKIAIVPNSANLTSSATSPTVTSARLFLTPPAAQLLVSLTAPIALRLAPAAQILFTSTAPGTAIGSTISPPRVDKLLTQVAPRVLPGRLIKPASANFLLTTVASAIAIGGANYAALPVWTAHTYAVGEQIATHQDQAYQCTTAGVSTIEPTGTSTTPFHMGTDGAFFIYLADIPMFNIIHAQFRPDLSPYNAKFDDATDDTTAWQTMFADIVSRGWGEVQIPAGISRVRGGQISIPNECKIRGQGKGSSVIRRLNASSTGLMLDMSGTNVSTWKENCELSEFAIDGLGAFNGGLLRIIYGNGHTIDSVLFTNTNDFALQMVQVWDTIISRNRMLQCGLNASATAFTTGDEGGGTTIGSEVVQILGAIAASGFGSSVDSSNQCRFRDNLIETFNAGAIVQARTSFYTAGGASSHDIDFINTKIESNQFTGKYYIQQTSDVLYARITGMYMGFQGASGANLAAMQGIYFNCNTGVLVRDVVAALNVNSAFQSILKSFAGGGAIVENITQIGSFVPSTGVLWVAGGVGPIWKQISSSGVTAVVAPTYYPPYAVSTNTPEDGTIAKSGTTTPGTALSTGPNTINNCNIVTGGTFFQIPIGSTVSGQSTQCVVINNTAGSISIKPPSGGTIARGVTDAAVTVASGAMRTFNSTASLTWF